MCAKKKDRSSSDFLRYLKDDLSNKERHAFERDLELDPFEKEAMEGLENISPEQAEKDILAINATLRSRLRRRKRVAWYSVAASVASILIVGTIFLNIYDLNPSEQEDQALTEESFKSFEQEASPNSEKATPADETGELAKEEALAEAEIPTESEEVGKSDRTESRLEGRVEDKSEAISEISEPEPTPVQPMEVVELTEVDELQAEAPIVLEYMAVPEDRNKAIRIRGTASKKVAEAPADIPLTDQVSGVVVSIEDMDPIPGVNIVMKGSSSGTVSDLDGRFTLPASDSQPTVTASFIGMETEEFQLETQSDNMLIMQSDPITLDEVVVIAMGSENPKSSLSSSTRSLEEEEAPLSYSAAEPPDGFRVYRKYIKKNMVFPAEYVKGKREIVVLAVTVTSDGLIGNINILRSPGVPYTLEAIRLIKDGPDWTPALVNGEAIDEQLRIRIVFKK